MITLLWLLTGCWDPTETGPSGMVGTVLDATGAPLAAYRIETLEAEQETGPDGSFALQYKAPNQLVHLHHGGLWYKRLYRPEDDGKAVQIQLSEIETKRLECGPCTGSLSLEWDLSGGLIASEKLRCGTDTEVVVPAKGSLTKSVCRGKGEAAVELRQSADTLRVLAPPRSLKIEITVEGEAAPAACVVEAEDERASLVQPGLFEARVRAPGVVVASCDGRPAMPVRFEDEDSVSIPWSRQGWELRSNDAFEVEGLHLTDGSWWLRLEPQSDGAYLLPPVGPGRYGVVMSSAAEPPIRSGWAAAEAADALVVAAHESGAWVGELWISGEREPGELELTRVSGQGSSGR